jgi:hypothetical protein
LLRDIEGSRRALGKSILDQLERIFTASKVLLGDIKSILALQDQEVSIGDACKLCQGDHLTVKPFADCGKIRCP